MLGLNISEIPGKDRSYPYHSFIEPIIFFVSIWLGFDEKVFMVMESTMLPNFNFEFHRLNCYRSHILFDEWVLLQKRNPFCSVLLGKKPSF